MAQRNSNRQDQELLKGIADSPGVKERILDRTIYLMGRLGTTEVTVRAIAREAGVNVAAVNYYFSSKERMMSMMAERFEKGFETVMTMLADRSLPPEKRLREWASLVMGFLAQYPGILTLMERQIAEDPLDAFGKVLRSTMQSASQLLEEVLREIIGDIDKERLTFKLTLFISTLGGPFPRQFASGTEPNPYEDPTQRADFLDLLIEHLKS
jgi:AcrR family transcriptional regulator